MRDVRTETGRYVPDAGAVVLAGGKSSRMGRPKALLRFDDEPLIVRIIATLRGLFDDIVVVAAPGLELPPVAARIVRDEVPYQGPVGGIYYGLKAAQRALNFVLSCDAVFLNTNLISYLFAGVAEHDVVVPHWQGRLQPLHAVYRTTVWPLLEAQLARGELRPVYLFEKVRTRRIDEAAIRQFDPGGWSFFNMNTPEDYALALKRIEETGERSSPRPDGSMSCTVELFGVARLLAATTEVPLTLPEGSMLSEVFAALAEKLPILIGRVISTDRTRLVEGHACNVNGLDFVRDSSARVNPGDRILILPADAGG